jgi:hypothetical protein
LKSFRGFEHFISQQELSFIGGENPRKSQASISLVTSSILFRPVMAKPSVVESELNMNANQYNESDPVVIRDLLKLLL